MDCLFPSFIPMILTKLTALLNVGGLFTRLAMKEIASAMRSWSDIQIFHGHIGCAYSGSIDGNLTVRKQRRARGEA